MSEFDHPCQLCGEPVRSLSMGGPTICPWCDTGGPAVRYKHELAMLRAHDASETAALRKVRDEMAVARTMEWWPEEDTKDGMATLRGIAWPHQLVIWLAAVDAILEARK